MKRDTAFCGEGSTKFGTFTMALGVIHKSDRITHNEAPELPAVTNADQGRCRCWLAF